MIEQELPLFDLFQYLREADFPLGIDDYQLLLRALQGGFGLDDQAALRRLCQTLWVKSPDDAHLFNYHFDQVMLQAITNLSSAQPPPSIEEPEPAPLTEPTQPLQRARPTKPLPMITAEPVIKVEDDVRVAQAMFQAATNQDDHAYASFISTDEYLPVTRRQMKQSWRHLRRSKREGPPTELDVEGTVETIGRQGMFLEPVLMPRRINRAELLLLIDQGGSMVPFHVLSRRLVETALRGGRLGNTGIYYFHNCPLKYLYYEPSHNRPEALETVLHQPHGEQAGVLIFSDAGAARGDFNEERRAMTTAFLQQLRQHFRHIAWLNPVPAKRWPSTTAGEIMQIVPMFDVSRRGLDNAISILRGRLIHLASPSKAETI